MKSLAIFFSCSMLLHFATIDTKNSNTFQIEILNSEELDFDFNIEHKPKRNQIHLSSAKQLKSLYILDKDNNRKDYKVIGTSLLHIPISDFKKNNEYLLKAEFIRSDVEAQAKITTGNAL